MKWRLARGISVIGVHVIWTVFAVDIAKSDGDLRLVTQRGHSEGINAVAFSPDGRHVVTGGEDGATILWHVETGREVRRLQEQTSGVRSVAFFQDGRSVVIGYEDEGICRGLWDVQTGESIRVPGHWGDARNILSVAVSPNGRQVLLGLGSRRQDAPPVVLWDLPSGGFTSLEGHVGWVVSAVAFSPDGCQALTGCTDSTARLWDVATGKETGRFEGHTYDVTAVAFSPDGSQAITGTSNGTLRMWNVKTKTERFRLEGHSDGVTGVAFSPDGVQAVTVSNDGTVRLWDVKAKERIQEFKGSGGALFMTATTV